MIKEENKVELMRLYDLPPEEYTICDVQMLKSFVFAYEIMRKDAIKYLKKNACYDEQENYFNDSLPEICCKPMLEILEGGNDD